MRIDIARRAIDTPARNARDYAEVARAIRADESTVARYWLDRKVPALQGRTPREVLLSGRIERLTGLLAKFNAGNTL